MIKSPKTSSQKINFHVFHHLNGELVINTKPPELIQPLKPLKPFPKTNLPLPHDSV
jgi:hypothetical protein